MPEHKIVITFPNEASKSAFWAWWLDGGGDDGYCETVTDSCGQEMNYDWDREKGTITVWRDRPAEQEGKDE